MGVNRSKPLVAADSTALLYNAKGDILVSSSDDTPTRLGVGSNTQVLTADSAEATGVKWAAGGGGAASTILAKRGFVTVVNTTTETTLLSSGITVVGGSLGTSGALRITCYGDCLNNSGSSNTWTLGVQLGSTLLWKDNTAAQSSSATRKTWQIEFMIGADGSAQQRSSGWAYLSLISGASHAGLGDLNSANGRTQIVNTSSTEDTSTNKSLDILASMSVANASTDTRMLYCLVEILV